MHVCMIVLSVWLCGKRNENKLTGTLAPDQNVFVWLTGAKKGNPGRRLTQHFIIAVLKSDWLAHRITIIKDQLHKKGAVKSCLRSHTSFSQSNIYVTEKFLIPGFLPTFLLNFDYNPPNGVSFALRSGEGRRATGLDPRSAQGQSQDEELEQNQQISRTSTLAHHQRHHRGKSILLSTHSEYGKATCPFRKRISFKFRKWKKGTEYCDFFHFFEGWISSKRDLFQGSR